MAALSLKPVCVLIAGMALASPSAFGATGAGADDGVAESSVRLPVAAETLGPADSASTVKTPMSNIQNKKANGFDELSVSVGDENYVSKPKTAVGNGSYEEISARVRGKTEKPIFSAAIDAGGSVSANVSNYSNVEVPEAYFRLQTPPSDESATPKAASVTLGRKKERWSGLDSDWSLGLVEPFNKFDALRPTEQGLTGLFAEGSVGAFSLLAFGSNIYVPEQGAPYDLNNGKFTTSSPWFTAPPDQLILLGQTRNALYNVNMPQTSEIINHSSYGLRARVAAQSGEGFYAQGSFLRKPMNAITLAFTGQLSIVEGDSYGDVNIYPEVVYDTITASDIGYTTKNFAVGVSFLHETPDQPHLADNLTTSHYSDMTMISPSAEVHVLPSKVWGPKFRAAYLTTTGGEVTAVGEYAQNGNVFGPRTNYRHAVSGSVETTLHRSERWSLDASARWIEELDELGTVVLSDLRLALGDSWRIAVQADLLGSRQPTSDTATFIARYRANDRTAVRLTYLF